MSANPADRSQSQALPSFSNLLEHLANPLPAPLVPRPQISSASVSGSDSSNSPPRNTNAALYSFRALPAPIRLANELTSGATPLGVQEVKKKPPAFGVLVRSDRASPAGPASRRMREVEEPEFECDRCGTTSTPEKRMGPNGRRTLCNRCGLRWAREQKEKEKKDEKLKLKRKVEEMIAVAQPPVIPALTRRRTSSNTDL